jgi:hypothetical protein
MAYIPRNAEWYVAEIIDEITVDGDARNIVHRNLILIRANSPDEAYDRALKLGRQNETEYENPAGQNVVIRFRGLGALSVVYEKLEHGAELRYIEDISVPEEKIASLVKAREQLSVFREIEPSKGPDYACKEILDEAYKLIGRDIEKQI